MTSAEAEELLSSAYSGPTVVYYARKDSDTVNAYGIPVSTSEIEVARQVTTAGDVIKYPEITRTGYKTIGYYTEEGDGDKIEDGTPVKDVEAVDGVIELWAYQSSLKLSYVFETNGGVYIQGGNSTVTSSLKAYANRTTSKANATFLGWCVDEELTDMVASNDDRKFIDVLGPDVAEGVTFTFYAKWQED